MGSYDLPSPPPPPSQRDELIDKSPAKIEEQRPKETRAGLGFYVDDVIMLLVILMLWPRFSLLLQSYGVSIKIWEMC